MDTLPGVLGDSLAEKGVLIWQTAAHVTLTGFNEVVHVNVILAVFERSAGENVFTKFLRERNMTN